ncbi:DNA helicase-2/ATP-dependent DNA helicase PcrA [Paenibacillus polymyxa]|uniref:UvrD-helicase domain-containing protein n=1 Tax=Paenibacillus TaxID=44249 RepID=UPI001CF04617|nr:MULTISPECIES: ATP-dependent helicase [Paenibacillus]MDQ0049247.1 DNA helicase-2/ATP-dependent DNA helicase PcrA [Paenibacillus polymyxa]
MNKEEMEQEIIHTLSESKEALNSFTSLIDNKVREKTEQQLKYVLSPANKNIFLEACAGSGKTEVVGMKTAYEIKKWRSANSGIAVLTFTNEATDTIKERVKIFSELTSLYPHYIGTLSGFIHGFIAQSYGYKFSKHKNREGDTSYRLIDKSLVVYDTHWLKKYKIPYLNHNSSGQDVYANQIYYDHKINDIMIYYSENYKLSLKEYYQLTEVQEFVRSFRKKRGNNNLLSFEFIKNAIGKAKQTFFEDGFANFEDMNNMAYRVLKKSDHLAALIATRFPLIIVDECQDLSWIEINILDQLQRSGSSLHFVGDLNQSIYEFKDADPATTKQYVSVFEKYLLTDNFRSCHSIVSTSNKLLGITLPIRGLEVDRYGEKSVCYLEYNDLASLSQKYIEFLKEVEIPFNNSAILVRQKNLKLDLETKFRESKHLILDALQLWIENTPKSRILALELASRHMHRWFGGAKTKKNYNCPSSIDSVYRWRIFIKDFLDVCSAVSDLVKFDGVNYSTWYKSFNNNFLNIVQDAYQNLAIYDSEKRDFSEISKLISPKGTAKDEITVYNMADKINPVSVNTIHSVKGKSFDSVMVVSSLRNLGSGHWKKWIEKDHESGRIGYVANTRAKYSLVWGVPVLNKEDRDLLESYGFKRAD